MAKETSEINTKVIYLAVLVSLAVMLGVWLDFVEADYQNSQFYLSESLLFSTFWWLFLPGLYLQFRFSGRCKSKTSWFLLFLIPVLVHLFAFPAVVWMLSYLFFEHTFRYSQTFEFALVEHLFKILILYSLPLTLFVRFKGKPVSDVVPNLPVSTMIVGDGPRRISIQTNDILYFEANPPYVTVVHQVKDYLSNDSLKSVAAKLAGGAFVQIHKSVIVNMAHVQSYRSRLNGDYDLTMSNGTSLRLSRTFARAFKSRFDGSHQVTV